MQREDALDADAVGDLENHERRADPLVVAGVSDALEELDALLVNLDEPHMNLQGVPGLEHRDVLAHLLHANTIDDVHRDILLKFGELPNYYARRDKSSGKWSEAHTGRRTHRSAKKNSLCSNCFSAYRRRAPPPAC
jgi:hypothetical protein